MKNSIKKIGLVIVCIFSLLSCTNKPSASDVEKNLRDQIVRESNDNIELISFNKTNATERSMFGQESYNVQYKAKVKIKKDCFMYVNKSGIGSFFQTFKTFDTQPEFIPSLNSVIVSCAKDEEVEFFGTSMYLKTENGWVAK